MEPRKLPKKIYLNSFYFVRVSEVPADDIQGDYGEWADIRQEGNPCVGIIRVSKDEDLAHRWYILRHELHHALIDTEDFLMRYKLDIYAPDWLPKDEQDDGPEVGV